MRVELKPIGRSMRGKGAWRRRGGLAASLLLLAVQPVHANAFTHARAESMPPAAAADASALLLLLERPASALVASQRAISAGDPTLSIWLLNETARRHPIVGDHARRLLAEHLLDQHRPAEAATALEEAIELFPDSPLTPELHAMLGHARAAVGNDFGARSAWRRALDQSTNDGLRASLLAATAVSQERSGNARAATETWQVLWYLYPISSEASVAETNLTRLEPQVGLERDARDWRRRADRLFRKRRNEAALAAYDHALTLGLSPSEDESAKRKRAQALFRMRDYPRAVEAFAELPQKDDIPIWHARSMARAGRVPEAIAEFEVMARKRRGGIALRARFLAALLLDGRSRFDEAREHLESLIDRGAKSSLRTAALWRLAWGAYQERHHADAIRSLDELIGDTSDPIERLRPRYWRARCLEALAAQSQGIAEAGTDTMGRDVDLQARRVYEEIAREYPLSYYGWRARTRLPASGEGAVRFEPWNVSAAAEFPSMGPRKLSPEALERSRILLEAGLQDAALDALARAAKPARGLGDRLELAMLYRSAGNYRAAQRLVLDPYKELLAKGPTATFEDLWWHAWPAAFIELVRNATATDGSVEPALVLAVMREESGFRPEVVSPVGARGLLQIMEPTGHRLAEAVGHADFDADDLFVPETNIRLGAHYLGELSAKFDGRLSAAIASYNAGPAAVAGWLEERGGVDDDEWVESIPYDQTRSYVKRVLRSLQAYRLLY